MNTTSFFKNIPILIKGGGDLASGVAMRLYQAGFPVVMTELPTPKMVRRTVSFGTAIYEEQIDVEGVTAIKSTPTQIETHLTHGFIPIIIDSSASLRQTYQPVVLIDAIMAKRNTGTTLTDAPFVIALGPGFYAGQDCHSVIETQRGHWLGRIILDGPAQPNTGSPGSVKGYTQDRVLRAPTAGNVTPHAEIGAKLAPGDIIATIDQQPITAPFPGVLRGLIHPQVTVKANEKIGDLDPRGDVTHCHTISDKSFAIGGGVLQAILASQIVRQKIIQNLATYHF